MSAHPAHEYHASYQVPLAKMHAHAAATVPCARGVANAPAASVNATRSGEETRVNVLRRADDAPCSMAQSALEGYITVRVLTKLARLVKMLST